MSPVTDFGGELVKGVNPLNLGATGAAPMIERGTTLAVNKRNELRSVGVGDFIIGKPVLKKAFSHMRKENRKKMERLIKERKYLSDYMSGLNPEFDLCEIHEFELSIINKNNEINDMLLIYGKK